MKIQFKPLEIHDLEQLQRWFGQEHVKHWWHLSDEELKSEYLDEGEPVVFPYFILLDSHPIGFIQYYYANQAGEGWWPDVKENDVVGIDQLIGEVDFLNKGLGSLILKQFVTLIFDHPQFSKIILDVHPDNQRAIRCYEKVGFTYVKTLETPDGVANMMELSRKAVG